MRAWMTTLLCGLSGAAFVGVRPAGAQAPDLPPPEVVRAFHDALARGETDAALSLMTEDAVIYESGGVEASRSAYEAHHLGLDSEFAQSTTREVLRTESGTDGEVAWVLNEIRTSGTFRGRAVARQGVETVLLRRGDAGWRIFHVHWSGRAAGG